MTDALSEIPEEFLQKYFPGGFAIRDEANGIVAFAFRNGPIENLHRGKYSELLEDEILSRIRDSEMKTLMISACEKIEWLLRLRESDPDRYREFIYKYAANHCYNWDR